MKLLKRLFRKKADNEITQPLPIIDLPMKYIYDAISNHLKMKTTGALLLTGNWGSGKTYHIKNHVFPRLENETEFVPLIVSLYGVADKNDIARKVLFEYFDRKGKDSNISTSSIAKNIQKFSEAVPFVKKYIDVEKFITGTGDNLFRFLPHDKLLICFDDLERVSDQLDTNDILGVINELVENKGSKVLIIANYDEIKGGLTFKEKTIEKTIHFTPNISAIIDSIIDSYSDNSFKDYLKDNKDYLLKTLDPKTENEADAKELEKLFSNIRTIKFAIEHFKYPFEIIKNKKDIADELTKTQLKSIWLFILSVSTEFRKPDCITFDDRKDLDKQASSFADFDFGNLNFGSNQDEEIEVKPSYSEKFKEKYYGRLSEQYVYLPEIYDLITSSKVILEDSFLDNLEKSFNVKEGKIHPAHELLNSFMHGFWRFTNEEFKSNLQKLLKYAENGEFLDIVSYLNAGVYLLGFSDMFNSDKESIMDKLENGLNTFLSNIKLNYMMINQLDIVSGSFKEANHQKLIQFIREKIKEVEKKENTEEAERLSDLIKEDASKFVKEFIPGDSTVRTPDKPIFHELDETKVKESVASWNGEAIMDVSSLLKLRYLDTGFGDRLTDELKFLENIEEGINSINLEEKTLSNHLIETELKPRIISCKTRLEGYKNALQ